MGNNKGNRMDSEVAARQQEQLTCVVFGESELGMSAVDMRTANTHLRCKFIKIYKINRTAAVVCCRLHNTAVAAVICTRSVYDLNNNTNASI